MRIKNILFIVFVLVGKLANSQNDDRLLYQSEAFKIFGNRVEQSPYKSVAESATKLITNYQLPLDSQQGTVNMKVREIQTDLKAYPSYSSGFKMSDALYQLSLEEMGKDIRSDQVFSVGEKWEGVWTKDVSFSALLSLALIEPETVKNSLLLKVKNKKIIQDYGTGGSWPVSTDRQVWILAAWEVYKVTGNQEWLKQAFEIASNTMAEDQKIIFDAEYGLFYGESTFLNWREQSYPHWMEPVDIYLSHSLSTNALFFQSYVVLAEMAKVLHKKDSYSKEAEKLKLAINKYLWLEDRGYYSQYLYGHYKYASSPRVDALGSSLCVLFGIADREQMSRMMANIPMLEYGIPCFFPQIPSIPAYHNEAIWPFVQAFWAWAGAKAHVSAVVEHGIASIYRQSALFLTNKENMLASTGDCNGLQINSDRHLGSVAGNLAIVYRLLFGLDPQAEQLSFSPFVPRNFESSLSLKGYKYRDAVLDITVEGFGDGASAVELDGVRLERKAILATTKGRHKVVVKMNGRLEYGTYNLEKNTASLGELDLKPQQDQLAWQSLKEARYYMVYLNGVVHKQFTINSFYFKQDNKRGEYQVLAVDRKHNESFLSRPFFYYPEKEIVTVDPKSFANPSNLKNSGAQSSTSVVFPAVDPKPFSFEVKVPKKGLYYLEFRYANGNGPIHTDNKCGLAAIYKSKKMVGTVVFPQRGEASWSKFGLSSPLKIRLSGGTNKIELRVIDTDQNFEHGATRFMIDQIRAFPAF